MCLDGSLPAKRSKAWSAVQGALVQQSKKPRWILFIQHLCIVIDKCTVLCKFLLKCWLCCPLADCIFPLIFAGLSVHILRLCLKAEELQSRVKSVPWLVHKLEMSPCHFLESKDHFGTASTSWYGREGDWIPLLKSCRDPDSIVATSPATSLTCTKLWWGSSCQPQGHWSSLETKQCRF